MNWRNPQAEPVRFTYLMRFWKGLFVERVLGVSVEDSKFSEGVSLDS